MDAITLLTSAFDSWLVERTGPNENSPTTQGVRLDVFATSMRDSKPIAANLRELAEGATAVTASDVNQRITDLVGTGLVMRTHEGCGITPVGRTVLERWRRLGVDTDETADELIRQTVLVDAGIRQGLSAYVGARDFWAECVELHPATSWFSNADALYMVSYLNYTNSAGYNPWRLIQASRTDVVQVTGADWDVWAASTTTPAGWSKTSGKKLVDAARSAASRYVGRVNFCMALEARRTALARGDVTAAISEWNVPHA